jgi:hypothetical protein
MVGGGEVSAVLTELVGAGSSILSNILTVIPKGSIGGIAVQATLEETSTDSVTVTDHPVEAGAQISDHAFYRPAELVMRCGWSNSSPSNLISAVSSLFSGGGASQFAGLAQLTGQTASVAVSGGGMSISDYVSGVYAQLLSLQQSLQPFTVVTSIRQYTNMVMTSLALTRDQKTYQALMVTATMRQVIIVNTVSTTLAPMANQATPANTAEPLGLGQQNAISGATPSPGGSVNPVNWVPEPGLS